jgi:hypothetical protein
MRVKLIRCPSVFLTVGGTRQGHAHLSGEALMAGLRARSTDP